MKKVALDEIREISESVAALLTRLTTEKMADGRYELENGIYVNVESYTTQKVEERRFEAHKRYVDIQFILSGDENIVVAPLEKLRVCNAYVPANDIVFYYTCAEGEPVHLNAGDALLLMPEDGHMPCVSADEAQPVQVRKAVAKIPLSVFHKVKYLVMDVDGTLTDGKIYMGESGELCKAFNIKDGYGIHEILPKYGIEPVIITGRSSKILENRCKELGINRVYQGVSNKTEKLKEILAENHAELCEAAYIGDDVNDLPCMKEIKRAGGLIGSPADAVDAVCTLADFVCRKDGGQGAVREFIDWIVG